MNWSLLAFSAGAMIAVQAAMNARLGVLLHSSMLGTGIAFLFALFFTLLAFLISLNLWSGQALPVWADIKMVPAYLIFGGGALSALGVGVFYYLIPKMGVGSMMSFALTGQILAAIIASHFGWFEQPIKPINSRIAAGLLAMISGVLLINWGPSYAP